MSGEVRRAQVVTNQTIVYVAEHYRLRSRQFGRIFDPNVGGMGNHPE